MAEKYSVTPKGQFHWAHVSKPDTTFKAEGQFHIKLQLTGEEATSMKTLVDVAHAEWKKEVNKTKGQKNYQEFLPYKVVMDDEGMESGIQTSCIRCKLTYWTSVYATSYGSLA